MKHPTPTVTTDGLRWLAAQLAWEARLAALRRRAADGSADAAPPRRVDLAA